MRALLAALLVAGCATLVPASTGPRFSEALRLGDGLWWRYSPVVVDLDRDGHLDVVATARLAQPPLHIWKGDGKGGFSLMAPTWKDLGFGAVAAGDVNGDGYPDIVVATHGGFIQTLLSDGRGGFTERIFKGFEGYAAAALGDLDEDGYLDLLVVGETKAGLEIYRGDGTGNWTLHAKLPEQRPAPFLTYLVGRAVAVADLNHDGHLDIVVPFQLPYRRPGLYVYYGDGRGGFTGGPVDLMPPGADLVSLVLADVNGDGHVDIVLNGVTSPTGDWPAGPDVYLGDGRGGWKAASKGLKIFKSSAGGVAVGDLDGDGRPDVVAGGGLGPDAIGEFGVFWFRPDGNGGWRRVENSGLPSENLSMPQGIVLADLDGDGRPEIIALAGRSLHLAGSIMVWKAAPSPVASARTPRPPR